jgi:S1-C subfamily serine protease
VTDEVVANATVGALADTEVVPETPTATPPPPTPPGRRRWLLPAGLMAAFVVAALAILAIRGGEGTTATVAGGEVGNPASVAEALGPAVVQIDVFGGLDAGGGVGSGVIYDDAGLVLTAHHVVSFGDEVAVRTADDRTFTGRVVGRAPERDLAVVALPDADDLTAATIAEPDSVEVGEAAFALGSPFGFTQSVTAGIISGLDRELETPVGLLTGLIQTDAPINPGNSGGPLADVEAKVIGINTAIATMSGGNDGVGFAVPVEDFADLLDEVEAAGGVDAPTVPAPEGGGLESLIPGLGDIPGLDQLQDLLDELLNPQGGTQGQAPLPELGEAFDDLLDELFRPAPVPPQQDLESLPSLDELLEELYGAAGIPDELGDVLDELFGVPTPDDTVSNEGSQA